MNFDAKTVFIGDNLPIMQGMNSGSIDLIYLDPPFNSNHNYAAPIGSEAAGAAFKDTWTLRDIDEIEHDNMKDDFEDLHIAIEAAGKVHGDSMKSYLIYMAIRLIEMKRLLKATGSIYLHCDPTASHYLKMVMDSIFGKQNFRNEVVWKQTRIYNNVKRFGRNHDILFYYIKSDNAKWNPQYEAHDEEYITTFYRFIDDHGRYGHDTLTRTGSSKYERGKPWRGIDPTSGNKKKCWTLPPTSKYAEYIESNFIPGYTQIESIHARLDALDAAGLIYWPKNGFPRLKRYLAGSKGRALQDVIVDIKRIGVSAKENTGYPTQKPLALLERIIKASSNPGDTVLDPFCGTGTTLVAADRLQREWVGIDIGEKAGELVQRRIQDDQGLFEDIKIRKDLPARTDLDQIEHTAPDPNEKPKTTKVKSDKLLHTHEEMKALIVDKFGCKCWGCNDELPAPKHLDVDHIIPKSEGGSNNIDNRALLCGSCNSIKSNKMTLTKLREENERRKENGPAAPVDLVAAMAYTREIYKTALLTKNGLTD